MHLAAGPVIGCNTLSTLNIGVPSARLHPGLASQLKSLQGSIRIVQASLESVPDLPLPLQNSDPREHHLTSGWMFFSVAVDAKNLNIGNIRPKLWMARMRFLVVAMKMVMGAASLASIHLIQSVVNCLSGCMGSFGRTAIPPRMVFSLWSSHGGAWSGAISRRSTISLVALEYLSAIKAGILYERRWSSWPKNPSAFQRAICSLAPSVGIMTKELLIAGRAVKLRLATMADSSGLIPTAHCIQCGE